MNVTDRIRTKIEQIEKLLSEVKTELETLGKEKKHRPKKAGKDKPSPSEGELQAEYESLYQKFIARNFEDIKDFIKGKTSNYLKAFCKANNLPIDTTKVSKDRVVEEVMQWMAQREAITKKAT